MSKFGSKFKLRKDSFLPLKIYGSSKLKPIKYIEKRGSAQCKSSIIFAAMRTEGITTIKAKTQNLELSLRSFLKTSNIDQKMLKTAYGVIKFLTK